MQQLFLDPADTSSAKQLPSAPVQLPKVVREFGLIPDFQPWETGDLLLFPAVEMIRGQRAIVRAPKQMEFADEYAGRAESVSA